MASHRQLDSPGRPAIVINLLLFALLAAAAQTSPAQSSSALARIEQLFREQKWQEIVDSAQANESPDIAFYYGTALARLERWPEAAAALEAGRRMAPEDPRFPTELAGVAFKQEKYAEAETWLRTALHLSPRDKYVNDFLGTVFFLEGNLEAALKYWNRVGKPHINEISMDPIARLDPVLLDRAFAFSPASTLELGDLQTTEARLDELHVFPASRFQLQALEDGSFDLVFHNTERNGCGGKWMCLLSSLGGLPAQTVSFGYYNLGRRAINLRSVFRWDGEKRRIFAELEAPVLAQPKWHIQVGADLCDENWAIRNTFSGPSALLGAFKVKRATVGATFTDVMSGNWSWYTNTQFSQRSYQNVLTGVVLTPELLTSGPHLKQAFGIRRELLYIPERRLEIQSTAGLSVSRLWSGGGRSYSQLQGSIHGQWLPGHAVEKYELESTIRAGRTFGTPPVNDLFMMGVLGDTDLLMRAHIATRDGKKGSAPLGRNYFVWNWDAGRNISPLAPVKIRIGPFVDTGRITDPISSLGSQKWLCDVGLEAKVRVRGLAVALSYGRDLRAGKDAFLARVP
jgi:tetratricopeptide (TPR) repeat protein